MKNIKENTNSVLIIVVCVLAIATLWSSRPAGLPEVARAQASSALETTGTIHTTGSAVIRVQPDKATIRIGVQTFAYSPRESQAQNARRIENVLKAIRGQGIAAKDIATDYFDIRPEYDYKALGKSTVVGYWTDNTVLVTLREVGKLSDVVAAALEAGATTVDDVSFTTTRTRELRDQARALAAKAALEKAQGLAGAVNLKVGDVTNIQENSWSYYWGMWNSSGRWSNQWANVQQNVMQAAPSSEAPQPEDGEFSLGQIIVQAQVDLTVEIGK